MPRKVWHLSPDLKLNFVILMPPLLLHSSFMTDLSEATFLALLPFLSVQFQAASYGP